MSYGLAVINAQSQLQLSELGIFHRVVASGISEMLYAQDDNSEAAFRVPREALLPGNLLVFAPLLPDGQSIEFIKLWGPGGDPNVPIAQQYVICREGSGPSGSYHPDKFRWEWHILAPDWSGVSGTGWGLAIYGATGNLIYASLDAVSMFQVTQSISLAVTGDSTPVNVNTSLSRAPYTSGRIYQLAHNATQVRLKKAAGEIDFSVIAMSTRFMPSDQLNYLTTVTPALVYNGPPTPRLSATLTQVYGVIK